MNPVPIKPIIDCSKKFKFIVELFMKAFCKSNPLEYIINRKIK